MTAPSNANTSGLAEKLLERARVSTDPLLAMYASQASKQLVTAASAQARIDAAEARADRLAKALDGALIYIENLGENIERNDVDMHLDAVERPFSFAQNARSQFPELCAALQQETQP